MLEATTKRVGLSFACLALLAGGCRPSTSPSTADKPVVVEDSKPNKLLTANQAELTQDYLGKLLGILNDGKLTAEMLTPSFKSKVAHREPITTTTADSVTTRAGSTSS